VDAIAGVGKCTIKGDFQYFTKNLGLLAIKKINLIFEKILEGASCSTLCYLEKIQIFYQQTTM
jgi:hypothetical protein